MRGRPAADGCLWRSLGCLPRLPLGSTALLGKGLVLGQPFSVLKRVLWGKQGPCYIPRYYTLGATLYLGDFYRAPQVATGVHAC
jgi:hypothetical protein